MTLRLFRDVIPFVLGLLAFPVLGAQPCPSSPEEAVQTFVASSTQRPSPSAALLTPRSLKSYRARIEQLVDDRYSPESHTVRARFFGPSRSQDQLAALSDQQLVSEFLSSFDPGPAHIDDVTVVRIDTAPVIWTEVTVSYRVTQRGKTSTQQRTLAAQEVGACWKVEVPAEAWVNLTRIAEDLKRSRILPTYKKGANSAASLQVVAARLDSQPGWRAMQPRAGSGISQVVWVAADPVLTEKDVEGASAYWDCGSVLRSEQPAVILQFTEASGDRLRSWTRDHINEMLAVAIDGEIAVFARIAESLGPRLSVCLPESTLGDTDLLAKRLVGKH